MEDSRFLGHFWRLGNGDIRTRSEAISGLLNSLCVTAGTSTAGADEAPVSSNDFPEAEKQQNPAGDFQFKLSKKVENIYNASFASALEYSINRLVHGLTSSREAVRQGYAAALTRILLEFPKAVPQSSVLSAIQATTTIRKVTLPSEQKDLLLGRIFGYMVMQQVGYFRSSICLSSIESVVEGLLEALDKKSYLQDIAAASLAAIVTDVDVHSPGIAVKFVLPRLNNLFDPSTLRRLSGESKVMKGVPAPFGLLSLYLKLHRYLSALPSSKDSKNLAASLDAKHQPWLPLAKDPLQRADMRDTCLLILGHQSSICTLHPKIPAAWQDLFGHLIHSGHQSPEVFQSVVEGINKAFFVADPIVPGSGVTHLQGEGTTQGASLQRIFYGFRVMLELLVTLKIESLRSARCSSLPSFLSSFWTSAPGFCRQLLFHCRSSPATPLRQAGQTCLSFLSQIAHGVPSSRLVCTPAKQRRNKSLTHSEIDIVSAAIYSSTNIGLVNCPQDSTPDPQTPLSYLYTTRMNVDEEIWTSGLDAFGAASSYGQLDSSSVVRLSDLFIKNLSKPAKEKLMQNLLDSFLPQEESISVHKWMWNFDLLSQLVFFSASSTPDLQTPSYAAAQVVLQSLASSLVTMTPKKDSSEASDVVGLPIKKEDDPLFQIPVISITTNVGYNHLKRKMANHLGPALGRMIVQTSQPGAKFLSEMKKQWNSNRLESVLASFSEFSSNFLSPVTLGLATLLTSNPQTPTKGACMKFFESDIVDANDEVGDHVLSVFTDSGRKMKMIFKSNDNLSSEAVNHCIKFGSLSAHVLEECCRVVTPFTSSTSPDPQTLQTIRTCIECALSVTSFSCLLLSSVLLNCQEEANEDELAAMLDLMKQLGASCYPEILSALPAKKAVKADKLAGVLVAMADVIPSIVSSPDTRSPSAAHGLTATVLLNLWKFICQHCSVEGVDGLIQTVLKDNEEKEKEDEDGDESTATSDSEGEAEDVKMVDVSAKDVSAKDVSAKDVSAKDVVMEEEVAEESEGEESDEEELGGEHLFDFLLSDKALVRTAEDPISEDEEDGVKNPFDPMAKQKLQRQRRHQSRVKMQSKFRVYHLIQSMLDAKLAVVSSAESLLQQLKWIVLLCDELRSQENRLARRMNQKTAGAKKQETMKLHADLSARLEAIVTQQCNKLMLELNKTTFAETAFEARTNCCEILEQLRAVGNVIVKGFEKCSQGSQRVLASQGAKSQALTALFVLCIGRFEDHLLSRLSSTGQTKHWLQFVSSIRVHISAASATDEKNEIEKMEEEAKEVEMESSGSVFTDLITTAMFVWIGKKHPQLSEKFFRSLVACSSRCLSGSLPIGFLGVPFAVGALQTSKLFVCRELLSVAAELQELGQKSNSLGLKENLLGQELIKMMQKWNLTFVESSPLGMEFLSDVPLLQIMKQATPAPTHKTFAFQQALLSWACGKQGVKAVQLNRSRDKNDSDGDDSDSPATPAKVITPVPQSCNQLRGIQRSAKVTFEQQIGIALKRFAGVLEATQEEMKDGLSAETSTLLHEVLTSSKQTTRPAHRRKRKRAQ